MEVPAEEVPARGRRWLRLGLAAALGVVAVPVGLVLVLFGPYLRDDRRLDRIVRVVALDWRDFGREAAVARLQYELDHQHIGLQVGDDACALDEPTPGVKEVRCTWHVDVAIPLTPWRVPLDFSSDAQIDPAGNLR